MKTGTLDKLKFKLLKNRLRVPIYTCIGLLEGLWYMTACNAPDGAIGRFSNEEIAAWLEWEGDTETLIAAMVEAKWLHQCQHRMDYRLLVHDWEDHCPNHIKNNMKRWGKEFAKDVAKESACELPKQSAAESPSNSSLTKPNQTKPSKSRAIALPPDFGLTPDREAYARKKGVQNPQAEMEAFRAHHEAHGKTMKNWDAAWRTWCINAKKFAGRGQVVSLPTRRTPAEAAAEKLAAELRAARASAKRYGLKPQMEGEPDDNFIARVNRDMSEKMAGGTA